MENLVDRLGKAIAAFGAELGSSWLGTLTQVWVPSPDDDGGVVLNTQGMPFSINGCGDLLALFRCISCKYKFSTDTTKTWIMGPVGRVYVTGEPELTHNVQEYEPSVYCRVVEARRCQVNSSLFLPIYTTPERDRVAAVMEVIQTECNAQTMRGLLDWARACLLRENLWTTMVDRDALPLGLRDFQGVQVQASAFESKIEPRSKDSVLPSSGAMPGTVSAPLQYSSQIVPGNTNAPPVPAAGTVTTVTTAAPNYPSGCEVVIRKLPPLSPSKPPLALAPDLCGNLENEDSAPLSLGGKQIGLASSCLPPAKIVQVGRTLVLESNLDQNQSTMITLHENPLADSVKEANVNGRRAIGKVCHRSLTMHDISPLFCFSLREAATRIGVCETTLKKTCRKLGLKKWPRQQINGEKLARANSSGDGLQRNSGTTWSTDTSGSVGQPEQAINGQRHVMENLPTVIPPLLSMPKTIFDAAGGILDPGNLEDSLPKDCRMDLHNWQPIDMHSLESLDILAAGDVEISVGNGPEYAFRGGSFQGLE